MTSIETKMDILAHLSDSYRWKTIFHYADQVDSTNDQLKIMARQGAPHGTVLAAGAQTGGHGRLGRSFHSPQDTGIYLSILLRPQCVPTELMHLTCASGVAMCQAVEQAAGFRPNIKWTNDLVYDKHKLGGILTEMGLTPQGAVDYAIVGIGINCCQKASDFPEEIRSVAASLEMAAKHPVSREALAAAMMESLQEMSDTLFNRKEQILVQYRKDCITIGKEISLIRGDEVRRGTALDVDDNGALVVAFSDGTVESVNSGEVSVRGMYGYV